MQATPEEMPRTAMTPQHGHGMMAGLHGQTPKGGSPQMPKVRQTALKQTTKAKDDKVAQAKAAKTKPQTTPEVKETVTPAAAPDEVVDLETEENGVDSSLL